MPIFCSKYVMTQKRMKIPAELCGNKKDVLQTFITK